MFTKSINNIHHETENPTIYQCKQRKVPSIIPHKAIQKLPKAVLVSMEKQLSKRIKLDTKTENHMVVSSVYSVGPL